MKKLYIATKGCGQLTSNKTYFADSWSSYVKTDEVAMAAGVDYWGPVKTIHKVFFSTEPGDPYFSSFPDIYFNVFACPVVSTHLLVRYFNACNEIYNHNWIWQSDIALDKYCVIQSGYFRLATKVALSMGIIYGNLLYCRGVSEVNVDKKISTLKYNNSTVYDCFDNPFTDEFGSPSFNLPPVTVNDIPLPHKRSQYTLDMLPATISVISVDSVSNFITLSYLPDLLPSDGHNTLHVMNKYVPFQGRLHR